MDAELVQVTLHKGDEVITVRVVVCERPHDDPPEPRTPQLRSGLAERRFAEALEGAR